MVQFVFTPWRNRAELLRVRRQLYPNFDLFAPTTPTPQPPSPWWRSPTELAAIEQAIARVFMWVHRGGCPHVVESTALLMSAIAFDEKHRGSDDAVAAAAVVSGYLMGFTRFVTGLLDSHQDKARKLSMYGVAKTLGLPAAFVELRHQGTHEPMPGLAQLRPAARRALVWIWGYYWRNLPEEPQEEKERKSEVMVPSKQDALTERMCRSALLGYLERPDGEGRERLLRQVKKWDGELVLKILEGLGTKARDRGVLVRSVGLARVMLGMEERSTDGEDEDEDEEQLRKELSSLSKEHADRRESSIWGTGSGTGRGKRKSGADEDDGDEAGGRKRKRWSRWEGQWTPRPIGVL